jgi:photosystem II PsbY protein
MDLRLLIVLLPLALALGWVAKNIGQAALSQGKEFIDR